MTFIIIVTIAIYILAIVWIWNNLGGIEKTKKVMVISIGFLLIYIITRIMFAISKGGIQYTDDMIEKNVKNILVAIFTGLNSLIILPYIAKLLNRVHDGDIEKEEFSKKVIIIIAIFIICMFFECGYMKDTQAGILKIYNSK